MKNDTNLEDVLKKKNREIYIKKLGIDLDKVLESLLITITNYINNAYIEVSMQLLSLENSDKGNKESPKRDLRSFYKKLKMYFESQLKDSFKKISTSIEKIENVDYESVLLSEKEIIISNLKKYYCDNIDEIIRIIVETNQNFSEERLEYYLKDYSYNKLMNIFNQILSDSFRIVLNSQQESFQKYNTLNDITVNKQNNL